MQHDTKQFLDLLQEYKSDETKKARRNLSTICFIIIAAWMLRVRIADIRVFGVDLSQSADVVVLSVAGLLVVYWLAMFLLAWSQDTEIQKERVLLLSAQVKRFTERYDVIKQKVATQGGQYTPPDFHEVEAAVQAYRAQQDRTRRASQFGSIIKRLEFIVPIGLALGAAAVLAQGFRNAL
jgi:hypothetical protein